MDFSKVFIEFVGHVQGTYDEVGKNVKLNINCIGKPDKAWKYLKEALEVHKKKGRAQK